MALISKKDPVSMKLRVANLKNEEIQKTTKNLEEESRKMEERLKELKEAMNREKEMREQRGGGFWQSGQEGNLSSHAKDVLNKPPPKPKPTGSGKSRKIKVLKDEPIAEKTTHNPPKPGTLAFLAQKGSNKVGLRANGPICGQCDVRNAVVTCQECSELYCSGCFTAFHLKGALAKHHSIPVTKNTVPVKPVIEKDKSPAKIVWEQDEEDDDESIVSENSNPKSLLNGDYDEQESAKSFQQALADWRQENNQKDPSKSYKNEEPELTKSNLTKKQAYSHNRKEQSPEKSYNIRSFSPVKTPRVNVDHGTSTSNGSLKPATDFDPQFQNTDISYADKLLLKQHRRSELPAFSSMSRPGKRDADDNNVDVLEPMMSLDSILAVVKDDNMHWKENDPRDSQQSVIIQEIRSDFPADGVEVVSSYQVDEDNMPAPYSQLSNRQSVLRSEVVITEVKDTEEKMPTQKISDPLTQIPRCQEAKEQIKKEQSKAKAVLDGADKENKSPRKVRPSSRVSHHPVRTPSRLESESRPRSVAEKAAHYYGEGNLTKSPSAALHDVITKYSATSAVALYNHKDTLGEFFTAGVKQDFTEKVIIPTKDRQETKTPVQKYHLSNKVYALSCKSWKPEGSLSHAEVDVQIPNDIINQFYSNGAEITDAVHAEDINRVVTTFSKPQASDLSEKASDLIEKELKIQNTNSRNAFQSPKPSLAENPYAKSTFSDNKTFPSELRIRTPRSARVTSASPRSYTPIVVDGDDMSKYDDIAVRGDADDEEAIDDLEVELASLTGRLTADGRVSQMIPESADESPNIDIKDSFDIRSSVTTPTINGELNQLRESMMDDFEENELLIMQDDLMRVSLL